MPPNTNTIEQTLSQMQFFADLTYWVKALVYGEPGTGKTIFACGSPNPVLLDADGTGALSLMNHPELAMNTMVLQVRHFNQVLDVLDAAVAGHPKFEGRDTFIIDTLTVLAQRHLDAHIDKELALNHNRAPIPFQQDYKFNTEAMRRLIIHFQTLPFNLICTAHDDVRKDDVSGIVKVSPALTPKLLSLMEGLFDIFGYMESETDADFNTTRTLQLMPNRRIKAKTRVGGLPPILKSPTFNAIIEAKVKMVDRLLEMKALHEAELAAQAEREAQAAQQETNQPSTGDSVESHSEQKEVTLNVIG
jgi:hypothetical protein